MRSLVALQKLEAPQLEFPDEDAPSASVDRNVCSHGRLEALGSGGSASYRRCVECGTVLVGWGGRLWALAATEE